MGMNTTASKFEAAGRGTQLWITVADMRFTWLEELCAGSNGQID